MYAREAQLLFHVLHLTPFVVIGFYVAQWEVSALVKYLAISLSSLGATLLLYDIGVRRTRPTRFLFGLKTEKTRRQPAFAVEGQQEHVTLIRSAS